MPFSTGSTDGLKSAVGMGGGAAPPFANKMIRVTLPYRNHCDGMMLLLRCKHGRPKKSEGLRAMTATRIATLTPTILVTVDTFQNRRGFEGLKAAMAGLSFRVTTPG